MMRCILINGTAALGNTLTIKEDLPIQTERTLSYSWQTSRDGNNWNVVSTDSTIQLQLLI